jgi:hypothetical protein
VPEGTEVSLPPSVEALANPSDLETTPERGSTEFTTSVPGGDAPTTTAPATTAAPTTAAPTTAAGGG